MLFLLKLTFNRSVAQLARASVSKTEGRGFETLHSCHVRLRFRQIIKNAQINGAFLV
jgi:hypothetical protein